MRFLIRIVEIGILAFASFGANADVNTNYINAGGYIATAAWSDVACAVVVEGIVPCKNGSNIFPAPTVLLFNGNGSYAKKIVFFDNTCPPGHKV